MAVVSAKQLVETGVYFGHPTKKWNPKMAPYIFKKSGDIHIIDLEKIALGLEKAYEAILDICKQGGRILFVGTKKTAQEAVKEEALRCGQFYVNQRWLGGTLTNFKTIKLRIKYLNDLTIKEADGSFDELKKDDKKRAAKIKKEKEALEKNLGGIKEMKEVPQGIFVVDTRKELNAILEARKLHIPVFGLVDTNCDPDLVDYVIPANDDATKSVKLIASVLANAVIEANGGSAERYVDEDVKSFFATQAKERIQNNEKYDGDQKDLRGKKPYNKNDRRDFNKPVNKDYKPFDGSKNPKPAGSFKPTTQLKVTPKPESIDSVTPVTLDEKVVVPETVKVVVADILKQVVVEEQVEAPKKAPKKVKKETTSVVVPDSVEETNPVKSEVVDTPTVEEKVAPKKQASKKVAKEDSTPTVKVESKEVLDNNLSVDYSALKVEELKELAKNKGIVGISKMKKSELIDALTK
ncbi:MAG: 30S ribosomal protein S2 [Acholeplasmatales bacterium]|nr:30S ribosomal protein S2 [Acholeplasmatales bacterium]